MSKPKAPPSRKFDLTHKGGLVPDPHNSNRGTKRGLDLLETSIEKFGAGRSVLASSDNVILAGNKTFQAAMDKGLPVRIVDSDGHELIVVRRKDLKARDKKARGLAIADNRVAEIDLSWDGAVLAEEKADGVEVDAFFFPEEQERLFGEESEFDRPHVDIETTCPQCGFKFTKKIEAKKNV